jgi:chorismate mutase
MIERWQLAKDARPGRPAAVRTVRCVEAPHPLGLELRVIVGDDDLRRSEVFRQRGDADAAAASWREAFEEKGWRAAPPRFSMAALRRALELTRHAQSRVPGDNAMGHVLSYRLKVMREALEVAVADDVSLDWAARERRVIDAMTELARAERGPEGQAFVKPIVESLT